MNIPLPPSIFFNLAKERPFFVIDGILYTLDGNKKKDGSYLFFSGEKIGLSESDSLYFFEKLYERNNKSKIKDVVNNLIKNKYDKNLVSYNSDIKLLDFIVNKIFYEYDHGFDRIVNPNINFGTISNSKIRNENFNLDVDIDFSTIKNKSQFESIANNVFIDNNFVFNLAEIADRIYLKETDNFIFFNNKHFLLQPSNYMLESLEKNYQNKLLENFVKWELAENKDLAKKLEAFENNERLKIIQESLSKNGYYESSHKGILKKNSDLIPYVSTDDYFVLFDHNTGKYFSLSKFRAGVKLSKSNGNYYFSGEPFVLEKKYHPFVWYSLYPGEEWKNKKNSIGFHKMCFNGRFSIDRNDLPKTQFADALGQGIDLLESGYMPNVVPIHYLNSYSKFKEISTYEMKKRGLKALNR